MNKGACEASILIQVQWKETRVCSIQNILGTPTLRVSRRFAFALYAAVISVASKIIIFYPEIVAQI